jgi:dephospho-CoA kinase
MSERRWFEDVNTLFRQAFLFGAKYIIVAMSPELEVKEVLLAEDNLDEVRIKQRIARQRGKVVLTFKLVHVVR